MNSYMSFVENSLYEISLKKKTEIDKNRTIENLLF